MFSNKPRSAPAGPRKAANSLLEDMISKDDRDWLDIASNEITPKKKEDNRPSSAGNVLDQPTTKPGSLAISHV